MSFYEPELKDLDLLAQGIALNIMTLRWNLGQRLVQEETSSREIREGASGKWQLAINVHVLWIQDPFTRLIEIVSAYSWSVSTALHGHLPD